MPGLAWSLAPLLVPLAALFGGGLALAVAQSVGLLAPVPLDGPWWSAWARLLDKPCLESALYTLRVALGSALAAVALGAVLAYNIWRLPAALRGAALVYKIPLVLPHIAVGFVILVLWTRTGFVASICHQLGIIDAPDQFPALLFAGNGLGLILAYGFKGTGFAVLLCLAVLARLDRRLPDQARMLGAGPLQTFRQVVLPHLTPALHTAFIILFLYAFGAFDIPYLLSESRPTMLSVTTYNLYFKRDLADRPLAMAILTAMFAFSALFVMAYMKIIARLRPQERKL